MWENIFERKFVLVILISMAIVSGLIGMHNAVIRSDGSGDFQWDWPRVLLEQKDPYQMALSNVPATTQSDRAEHVAPVYFPSCLMLLWPYAILPWSVAKVLWLISNIFFTFLFLFNLFKVFLNHKPVATYLIISCLFLMGTPWRAVLATGQHTMFSLCLFSFAIKYLDTKPTFSGFFLALSFLKYAVTVPLALYFVYKRQFRPLLIAFAIHLGLHLFLAYWINVNPVTLFGETVKVDSQFAYDGYLDFFALIKQSGLHVPTSALFLLSAILFIALVFNCFRISKTDDLLVLSMLGFVSVIIVYHAIYDYVILIFPLLLLFKKPIKEKWFKTLLVLCVFFIWYLGRWKDYFQTQDSMGEFINFFHAYDWMVAGIWFLTAIWCLVMVGRKTEAGLSNRRVKV